MKPVIFLLCVICLISAGSALNLTEHNALINITAEYLDFFNQSEINATNVTNMTSCYNDTTWIEFNTTGSVRPIMEGL